jgi:hypothetical protein
MVGSNQYQFLREKEGYRDALDFFDKRVKKSFKSRKDRYQVGFPRAGLKDNLDSNIEHGYMTLTG